MSEDDLLQMINSSRPGGEDVEMQEAVQKHDKDEERLDEERLDDEAIFSFNMRPDDLPWMEKHRPTVPSEIAGERTRGGSGMGGRERLRHGAGHVNQVKTISNWLKGFLQGSADENPNKKFHNIILMSGPPGLGKTTIAHVMAK
eukprot:757040-Hanusia_phi.AAC.4